MINGFSERKNNCSWLVGGTRYNIVLTRLGNETDSLIFTFFFLGEIRSRYVLFFLFVQNFIKSLPNTSSSQIYVSAKRINTKIEKQKALR